MAGRETRNLSLVVRRLSWARLLVAGAVLVVGVLLAPWDLRRSGFTPFVLCLAGAALASGAYLAVQPGVSNLRRFAAFQLMLDVALTTAIIAVTGGPTSIFSSLYVLSVTAACVLLSRQGGLVIAGLASLLYAGLLVGRTVLPPSGLGDPAEMTTLALLTMFTTPAALLTVAVLAGSLAERSRHMQQQLEVQGRDLRNLEAFKDLIFESVGTGLVALDPSGRVTAFNRAAEELTGFTTDEAVGQPWEAIFGLGVAPNEILLTPDADGLGTHQREIHLTRQDGRKIPLGISFWPLRFGDGEPAGLIGACQDLSETKRMEQRLRRADRLATLGRLAANIAHEIRNPLAAMSGAIEQLAGDLGGDATRDRLIQIVLRESERLNRIVADLLEYARPAPIHREPANFAELLDEVVLLLERHPHAANVKIVRECEPDLSALVDIHQLRQALWNLCLNAVEAMADGGELTVGVRRRAGDGSGLEVRVSDTGPGIKSEDLPNIFEPFFSTKADGTGLGLAVVHRVVQDHGGEVEVQSGPGGTTFILSLAVAPDTARPTAAAGRRAGARGAGAGRSTPTGIARRGQGR